ncbi:MAG: extracellular solute-binding protein, partial [Paracoccaceae bacterium]|nr:extracellular solute-binding protein [Paracoccaceae bacterium]
MTDEHTPITKQKFMQELYRYKRGSVTRRHFLNVTGLGVAAAAMAGAMPGLRARQAFSAGNIGDRVILATWPNYHDPANFEAFTAATGAAVQVNVFGSNEEMLAKLQAGGSGWDVFVPTNYTITTYVEQDLIEPLDLSLLPNYDPASFDERF